MNEFEGTPVTWVVTGTGGINGYVIRDANDSNVIVAGININYIHDRQAANLIASAPKLYEALANLCDAVEKATPLIFKHDEPLFQIIDGFLYQARDVFTEARGEASNAIHR